MAKGFDCATPLTQAIAEAFVADGMSIVARYLVPSGEKRLTKTEAEIINVAGLDIVSVFETTANRALGGREAGLEDGAIAAQVAKQVGQPIGSCIYFAVDFDASAAQMATIIEYIRAASEATPDYTTGVYGSYSVIQSVKVAGACSRFWQTYAWSRGQKAEGIHIYQFENDITANGIGIDRDEVYDNEGAWNSLVKEIEPMLKVEDADLAIGLFQEAYRMGVTKITKPNGEIITVDQDKIHELANAQRRASGQPQE